MRQTRQEVRQGAIDRLTRLCPRGCGVEYQPGAGIDGSYVFLSGDGARILGHTARESERELRQVLRTYRE